MRPVRLDIHGFASFREPATVDFTDVDYFSLVGPTGSGKSTIIDAITFALYGTAYRWERANAIAYALAPTTNRCTVSLIFDVAGERYQAAREVRRVGQQIQQKAARLERFTDPTACPAPGDDPPETVVLASEVRDMAPAVSELLGLEFDDFCQCVVLPQGEFARFLKAAPRDRQTILLKLLGSSHYEQIGKVAGARAKEAEKEVEIYSAQLRRLADATPEALHEATARRDLLAGLNTKITDLVARVLSARETEAAHSVAAETAKRAAAALGQLKAPEGLVERHASLTTATEVHVSALAEAAASAAALTSAIKEAEEGPQAMAVEAAERLYGEADQVRSSLNDATRTAEETREAAAQNKVGSELAQQVLREARAAEHKARDEHALEDAAAKQLTAKVARLSALVAPPDLDAVAISALSADAAMSAAAASATEARAAAESAADACRGLPDVRTLQALEADRIALAESIAGLDAEVAKGPAFADAVLAAASHLAAAAAALESAQSDLESARTRDAAAALRPSLEVGHECPVCTQTVTILPSPPTGEPELDSLDRAWRDAQTRHKKADDDHRSAVRAADLFDLECAARTREIRTAADRLFAEVRTVAKDSGADSSALGPINGDVTESAVNSLLVASAAILETAEFRCTEAFASSEKAAAAVKRAELEASAARDAAAQAQKQVDAHRSSLVRVHTGVEADGAPGVDASTLEGTVAGWTALTSWAAQTLDEVRNHQLPAALTKASDTKSAAKTATANLTEAERAATEAIEAASKSAAVAAAAAATLDQLTGRDTDLAAQLASLPDRAELPALLAQAEALAAKRAVTTAAAEQAQSAAESAAAARQTAQAAVASDRDAFSTARDTVAPWVPPTFSVDRINDDLVGCFSELVAWAAAEASEQEAKAEESVKTRAAAAQGVAEHLAALTQQLAKHDVAVAGVDSDPRRAERDVAVAHSEASAMTDRLAEALARKDEVLSKSEDARERAIVAGELRTLLRSDKFQQWLATAALDTLVAAASTALFQLSDSQFTLTHEKGEFFVTDHFDADSPRSVRTLSGGETFQASLALALALSEQMATLAIGGNAQLDSIFLDEGFGTLDSDALETVAATLENLAAGERMVGVVTHVAALAERTPVRFVVTHDNRTSRVEREAV